MANFLRQAGGIAFLLGVAAVVMNYLDMVPKVLIWIYMWGENTAWIIKISLIVVGIILWIIGSKLDPQTHAEDVVNKDTDR